MLLALLDRTQSMAPAPPLQLPSVAPALCAGALEATTEPVVPPDFARAPGFAATLPRRGSSAFTVVQARSAAKEP